MQRPTDGDDEPLSPRTDDDASADDAALAAELADRAKVIARKIWFLRHAALCRDPDRCPLGPCRAAIGLVSHMRCCGAMSDPTGGCRAPACARAARLLHHPRSCPNGAHCAVCRLLRAAGAAGTGLVLPKDLVCPRVAPLARTRGRSVSAPALCDFASIPEDAALAFDDDEEVTPPPLPRKRSWCGVQPLARAALKAPPVPTVDQEA